MLLVEFDSTHQQTSNLEIAKAEIEFDLQQARDLAYYLLVWGVAAYLLPWMWLDIVATVILAFGAVIIFKTRRELNWLHIMFLLLANSFNRSCLSSGKRIVKFDCSTDHLQYRN